MFDFIVNFSFVDARRFCLPPTRTSAEDLDSDSGWSSSARELTCWLKKRGLFEADDFHSLQSITCFPACHQCVAHTHPNSSTSPRPLSVSKCEMRNARALSGGMRLQWWRARVCGSTLSGPR